MIPKDFPIPVGPDIYTVKLVSQRLEDRAGESVAVLADHSTRKLYLSRSIPTRDVAAVIAIAVAQAWRERLEMYAGALREKVEAFSLAADAVDDVDFEASEDDGPQFISAFDELVKMGVNFDPRFAAGIEAMRPQHDEGRETESFIDGGEDVDDGLENEDPNLDHADVGSENEYPGRLKGIGKKATADWLNRERRNRRVGANLQCAMRVDHRFHRPIWVHHESGDTYNGARHDNVGSVAAYFDTEPEKVLEAIENESWLKRPSDPTQTMYWVYWYTPEWAAMLKGDWLANQRHKSAEYQLAKARSNLGLLRNPAFQHLSDPDNVCGWGAMTAQQEASIGKAEAALHSADGTKMTLVECDGKDFVCQLCGKTYRTSWHCQKHLNKHGITREVGDQAIVDAVLRQIEREKARARKPVKPFVKGSPQDPAFWNRMAT